MPTRIENVQQPTNGEKTPTSTQKPLLRRILSAPQRSVQKGLAVVGIATALLGCGVKAPAEGATQTPKAQETATTEGRPRYLSLEEGLVIADVINVYAKGCELTYDTLEARMVKDLNKTGKVLDDRSFFYRLYDDESIGNYGYMYVNNVETLESLNNDKNKSRERINKQMLSHGIFSVQGRQNWDKNEKDPIVHVHYDMVIPKDQSPVPFENTSGKTEINVSEPFGPEYGTCDQKVE